MPTLNTACGWVATDPVDLLIAAGRGASPYEVNEVIACMNQICEYAPSMVGQIQSLIDEYQNAQLRMIELNNESAGKTLIKADVLEWKPDAGVGSGYSPEREVLRVRGLIQQYMNSCPVISGSGYIGGTSLLMRS